MSRIFVTGDIHGDIDIHKLSNSNLKCKNISFSDDDYIIILGDFGLPFSPMDIVDYEKHKGSYYYWINWLSNRKGTYLFVDGNHDNHEWWSTVPITNKFNGKVQIHPHASNVIHLMRGQVYTINNKTFFTMGGAKSVDKAYRKEHISWWKDEMPSKKEYELAIKNLNKYNMTVDYVLSHNCGTSYLQDLVLGHPDSDTLTSFFNHLEFDFGLNFKHWYFGHHHIDKQIDSKHTCVYYNIIEIN